jgi:HAD superfamily hydrolase (TIGR01490 family)
MNLTTPPQANSGAPRRAAFFDVDGTLTNERTWKGLLDYFQTNRLRRRTLLAFKAVHYPLYFIRRLGLISESAFRGPWAANLAWFVRGFTEEEANQVWDWNVEHFIKRFWREDMLSVLEKHQKDGDLVMLVSSGPQPMMKTIACALGVEHAIGTRFEMHAGRYTGSSLKPICIDEYKAILAKETLQNLGIPVDFEASFAYADSTSDLLLLEMVGNPVAVYPGEQLKQIALQRGWRIIPDLAS